MHLSIDKINSFLILNYAQQIHQQKLGHKTGIQQNFPQIYKHTCPSPAFKIHFRDPCTGIWMGPTNPTPPAQLQGPFPHLSGRDDEWWAMRASKSLRCLNKTTEKRRLWTFCSSVEIYPHHRIHCLFVNIFTYVLYSWFFSKISVVRNIPVPWLLWVHHRFWFLGYRRGPPGRAIPSKENPFGGMFSTFPEGLKYRCVNFKQHKAANDERWRWVTDCTFGGWLYSRHSLT